MRYFSIAAVVQTCITFWQQIGTTIDLNILNMPGDVSKIVTWIRDLLEILVRLLPSIPNFDTRGMLVIISFGVPLAIDLASVWFVKPLFLAILHLIDIFALVIWAYSLTVAVFGAFDLLYIVLFAATLVYILIRFFIYLVFMKKKKQMINEIVEDIKRYFLDGIFPDVKSSKTFEEIDTELREFSGFIEITSINPPIWIPIIFIIVAIIVLILSLILARIIKIPGFEIPIILQTVLPFIGYVFALVFLIVGILKFFSWGNRFLLKIKKFSRRWSVYLLMFLLSMLYIPIITSFSDSVGITRSVCPAGTYPNKTRNLDDPFDMFVSHHFECQTCNMTYAQNSTYCSKVCKGVSFPSILKEKNLNFVHDILTTCLPAMIYCVVIFVLGIPFLWYYIIRKNTRFMRLIPAYGYSTEEKWQTLTRRMKSTGIYLFDEFRYGMENWSLVDFFGKAIIVIIAYLAKHFNAKIVFGFPTYFIIFFFVLLFITPYMYKMNNILDICLYFFNFLFTAVPLLYHYGVKVPIWTFYTLCGLALAIPIIIFLILLIVFRHKKSHIDNFDPTIVRKLTKKQLADRNKRIQQGEVKSVQGFYIPHKLSVSVTSKKVSNEEELDDLNNNNIDGFYVGKDDELSRSNEQIEIIEEGKAGEPVNGGELEIAEEDVINLHELKNLNDILNFDAFVYQNLPEDFDTITASILSSIDEAEAEIDNYEPMKKEKVFSVNKHMLARRIQAMYQIMDIILDGNTMSYIFEILNLAVLVGSLVFGWYTGSVMQFYDRDIEVCH